MSLKGKLNVIGSLIHVANVACVIIVPAAVVLIFQPPPCKLPLEQYNFATVLSVLL